MEPINKSYKKIEDFENYIISEDGEVYNIKSKNKISHGKNYKITLFNKVTKTLNLLNILYESFYNTYVDEDEIVKLTKDELHYKNLKLCKYDKLKEANLDKTKEWKLIKNYNDYAISNYADIYSFNTCKLLTPQKDYHGYYSISLRSNNKSVNLFVHRLVYDAFKNIKDLKNQIDHIDRNPSNNFLGNLRETTAKENVLNRNKIIQTPKIIHQFTLDGVFIKQWDSYEQIQKDLGYNAGHVGSCANGHSKSAHGFIWKNMNIVTDLTDYREIEVEEDDEEMYSLYKINKKGQIIGRNNILLTQNIRKGYYVIHLKSDSGKDKSFRVHRLVALTFKPNPNDYPYVNHIDENKLNNNLTNLEWCDQKHNMAHSMGKEINQIDIKTNKVIKTFKTVNDVFRELGKNYGGNIRLVCEGKRNSAFGYKWQFAK